MEITGERVVPGATSAGTLSEHLARYAFASAFCERKAVLDAACGTGYGSLILSMTAKDVVGVDINIDVAQYAAESYKFFSPANFVVADLERDFPDATFDVVVSFETIEHLGDPDVFLGKSAWALRGGGHFIFSVPREAPSNYHQAVYTVDEIKALIGKHFKTIKWYGQAGTVIGAGIPLEEAVFVLGVAHNES